ncbi:MAG: carboxypeptidase regulatory-like domain-containing protein [Planctomycetota bacterium]|nr:carboxypeptidase regulatory-like domain-containing protein [Planctomycetota bacterium]
MRGLLTFILAIALSSTFALAGECPGDVNGDDVTDVNDLLQLLGEWGCEDCDSDINDDGFVDTEDLLLLLGNWGCEATQGDKVALSGTVINLWTGDPIAGASVWVGSDELETNEDGFYTGNFMPGQYTVTFEAEYFISHEEEIILFPEMPMELDAALEPVAAVMVEVEVSGDAEPDGMVEATAIVTVLDGSSIQGYSWMQTGGVEALIEGADTDTALLTLGEVGEYKAELVHALIEPPIGEEAHGGLQNRFHVVGIYPFALEEAGLIALEVEVTTTSGMYYGDGEVHTHVPWKSTLGIHNVPYGIPVLLHGKDQADYDWVLNAPPYSDATLLDPDTQNPEFTPDWPGTYEVTVTDTDAGEQVELTIYAGTWEGVIVGQDDDGNPVADPTCLNCHENLNVGNTFEPWAQTGHAEIFSDNLDNSTHYGTYCFPCHTVGYDTGFDNGGIDDAPDYQAFLDSGLINNPGDNWTTMLEQFPEAARLANIQCENCHGPQDEYAGDYTPAHTQGAPRMSLSSDLCASCHGEPPRHARFQQWQLSGHANYELAIDESQSGNCSRCHTANGFLAWMPALLGEEGDPGDNVEVTWTEDEAHPQTCTTCHDPHNIGTSSGHETDAIMRLTGHTPPLMAGYTAYGVGKGAICMTCHNSRRGLRNDGTFDEFYGTSEAARAPHGPTQTDIIMGENAYLVDVGYRGNHSFLTDTCVKCHLERTPPPEELSYNLGGTNHTFAASTEICADCHGEGYDAESIQEGVHETLDILQGVIETALLEYIGEQTGMGRIIDLDGEVQITDAADVVDIEFGDFRGRHAMTVTFADESVSGPYRMSDITILDANQNELGAFYDFADPNLIKAGWNWLLVHNDGSLGVHNPTYSYLVMSNAIAALDPGAAPLHWPAWLEGWEILRERRPGTPARR